MKIIILNGKGACGKDTFIDLLKKYCKVFFVKKFWGL